ncbi:hypothetical protein V5799_015891 [Amblyomma americanum]|uniref:Uncharacterized protein n=1 Tax=Amblyomma americanum TaxID=6943 RepID=A0AAQ4F6P2_AMBAM
MQRSKENRTVRRQQNAKLINEAKAALGTTDIGTQCSLIETLGANNDELLKINAQLEDSVSDEDFAYEIETVLRYEDATRGMLGQLKANEAELLRAPRVLATQPAEPERGSQYGGGEAVHRSAVKLLTLQLQTFNVNICVLRVSTVIESTERLVKGFWDLESIGIIDHTGGPNEEAEAIAGQFERNIRMKNGRYEVALPWKENSEQICDHRSQALKRLKSLGKRIQRTPEFVAEYESTMRSYIDMSYAERVTPEE